jgi:CrcB protein
MNRLLIVFVGSGVGGCARYLFGGWVQKTFGELFPYGTIAINALGSFLIVVIVYLGIHTDSIGADARLALTTGLMGGFTTYSTFNYETISFFERGALFFGALNVVITVAVCLLAGALGLWFSRWLTSV